MLALLFVQQILVASSTIWLVMTANAVYNNSGNYLPPLLLYLASLVLPYFPGGFALVYLEKWSQSSQLKSIETTQTELNHKPLLWIDLKEKEKKLPLFAKEGLQTISGFTSYFYDLAACSLNALLNVITLSWIVEPLLLLGYGASLVMAALLVRFQAPINQQISSQTEQSRIRLSSHLFRMWDNLVLGNSYNRGIWSTRLSERFSQAQHMNVKSVRFNQLVAIGIALLTMLPTFIILIWSLQSRTHGITTTIAIVVSLPRIFQILNSSHQVLSLISSWSTQKGKIEVLDSLFKFSSTENLLERIKFAQIQFEKHGTPHAIRSVDECLRLLNQPGRMTLRGPNGSGKSTLLLLLKNILGSRAYYLPAQHSLTFQNESKERSTGEQLFESLKEIAENNPSEVLLLDEWDANLDDKNKDKISLLIDNLSIQRGIVEIRHHSKNQHT